jgi:hypothetical protein
MFHGNAIIAAMKNSSAEIHTWNDGLAASMGGDIWLAGTVRHMAKNSLLMIHSPSSWAFGTAKDLRNEAEVLDKFEETAIVVMAEATGLSESEVKDTYYDYEDHWLTAKECEAVGFISKVEDFEAQSMITDVDKMSYQQIVNHFAKKGDVQAKSWLQQIKEKVEKTFQKRIKTKISNTKIQKMNSIDDIIKEVEAGNLNKVALLDRLNQSTPTEIETPEKVETPTPSEETTNPDTAKIEKLESKIENLTKQIEDLKKEPASSPSKVHKAADDYQDENKTDVAKELDELNEKIYQSGGGFVAY